jgi:glucosylceramidase
MEKVNVVAGEKAAKKVQITPSVHMQSIVGFGGAFTDAAGINLVSLDSATQEQLMQSYYGQNGRQFNANIP